LTIALTFPRSTWSAVAHVSPGLYLNGTISGPTLTNDRIEVQVIYNVPSTADRPIIAYASNLLGGSTSWNLQIGTVNGALAINSPGIAINDDLVIDLSFAAFHSSGVQFDSLDVNGVFKCHSPSTLYNLLPKISAGAGFGDRIQQILDAVYRPFPSP
jgi:hypothetical protein